MANQVLVAKTTSIKVNFYANGVLEDPDLVEGSILDKDLNTIDTFVPVNLSTGLWGYDWTPLTIGSFYIELKGTFSDSTVDIARELFEVVASIDSTAASRSSLGEDQFLNFVAVLEPMYLDVQAVLDIYPDLDPVTAAEYIHIASLEAEELLDASFTTSQLVLDFILASALCSLSKTASIGDYGEESVQLGDLAIRYKTSGGSKANRGTAANWCELAFALRSDLSAFSANPRSFLKGSAYGSPIPTRELKDIES